MNRATRILALLIVGLGMFAGASEGRAEERVAVLSLDGLSFVSFGDRQNYAIPSGSSIRFRLGTTSADGSIPLRISPEDVNIGEISLGSRGVLRYGLVGEATGRLVRGTNGARIDLTAPVRATIAANGVEGSYTYSMPFTTEVASSRSVEGDVNVSVTGMRVVESARYVQLVGATVNKTNAYPEPGTAVYTVLSGTFDELPTAP